MNVGSVVRRTLGSIPRGVRWAVGLGTVAHFGSPGSAVTYCLCVGGYEALAWFVGRDVERVRRGLCEHYGIELPR